MDNKNNSDVSVMQPPAAAALPSRQPATGLFGLGLVMLMSWLAIGGMSGDFFATWATFFLVCCVPPQIVLSMVWRNQYPHWLGALGQPRRGIAQLALTLLAAALIATLVFIAQVRQPVPPTPMTLMYVIFCVLVTFWLVLVWECWPLAPLLRHPLALGLGILVLAYLLGYGLFSLLFDFSALTGAPFYQARLDPHGALPALEILAFSVTTVAVIFACLLLDFWPVSQVAGQPWAGIARGLWVLLLSAVLYGLGTRVLGIEPVPFMARGAIALLFGVLVPLLMFEGQVFAGRGVRQLLLAIGAGGLLSSLYWLLAPWLGGPPESGAPGYAREFWLASALLAMTFPLMVVLSQFLDFWPLRRR